MSQDKKQEIILEDKKAGKKFAIMMVIAFIVGIVGGILIAVMKRISGGQQMAQSLQHFLYSIAPFASLVINAVVIIAVSILRKQSKNMFHSWDGEDEKVMEKIEFKISYGFLLIAIDMVFGFFFFGVGFAATAEETIDLVWGAIRCVSVLGGLIATLIVITLEQKALVNFEKEMNPEKKGSIYDFKFAKKWEESCDEAEKLMIYQAAYTSYQSVNICCIGLWLFCVIGMEIWNFGLMPLVMILVVQMVSTVSFGIKSLQLSKHKM